MSEPALPASKPKARWLWPAVAPALIAILLVGLYVTYRHALQQCVQTQFDAIHQQAYPVTLVELDKWYELPPPSENAALVFTNAFASYELWSNRWVSIAASTNPGALLILTPTSPPPRTDRQIRSMAWSMETSEISGRAPAGSVASVELKRNLLPVDGWRRLPPRGHSLEVDTKQLIEEYLTDNDTALQLLHKAANMNRCRFPIDLTEGSSITLHHLNHLRLAARLLYLEALLREEEGNTEQAIRCVTDSLGIARSLADEPVIISQLVRVGVQGISIMSLERLLNRTALSEDQI